MIKVIIPPQQWWMGKYITKSFRHGIRKEKGWAYVEIGINLFEMKFAKTNVSRVLSFTSNRIKRKGSRKKVSQSSTGKAICKHGKRKLHIYTLTI